MRKKLPIIALVILGLLGVSLLLYPTISDWWNEYHQSKAIAGYVEAVDDMSEQEIADMKAAAQKYNEALLDKTDRWNLTDEEYEEYMSLLDITGTGIMAYVDIPSINVSLPVYQGTDESVLQIGVGHIEGSSLPIGGPSTHSVLSSHRGLRSAKLFTNIDQLVEGDIFYINTLGETLTYQVDQIRIVLPDEMSDLKITLGEDYCTLMTCTPYGVNSHRLLVRGRRIPTEAAEGAIVSDVNQVNPLLVAVGIGIILIILYSIITIIIKRKILFRFL